MKKVLIIVDMQNFFLKNMESENKKLLIQNQLHIIKSCVRKKIPIIELEYACLGIKRGKTIHELNKKYAPIYTIIKKDNGGFTDTLLEEVLTEMKIKEIVLVGINANGCVQDTAIGGINRGYNIVTSLGCIANVLSGNLMLSKSNLQWYKDNTILHFSPVDLIKCL